MFLSSKIKIIQGDITEQNVDVIVNSANPRLSPGGGLSGYIHKKAGTKLALINLEKLKELGKWYLEIGEPVITDGLKLNKKIIHVVGPKYHLNNKNWKELMGKCYINSLKLAESEGFKTIAFPSIATNIYGCPINEACPIVLKSLFNYIKNSKLDEIQIVLFNENDFNIYQKEYEKIRN